MNGTKCASETNEGQKAGVDFNSIYAEPTKSTKWLYKTLGREAFFRRLERREFNESKRAPSQSTFISISILVLANKNETKLKSSSIQQLSTINRFSDNSIIINKNNKHSRLNLLESIDNLSYRIIGLGFPLLTIGIISGAVWANEAWGSYWSWDPKETWALITWLIFAAYLHSRFSKSWKGKKPAILASVGFIVVWICYLGVNFLGKGLHSYGWLL